MKNVNCFIIIVYGLGLWRIVLMNVLVSNNKSFVYVFFVCIDVLFCLLILLVFDK